MSLYLQQYLLLHWTLCPVTSYSGAHNKILHGAVQLLSAYKVDTTNITIAIGGVKKTASGDVYTSDIHKFNKISHSWEVIGQIPSARGAAAAVNIIADNKIVVVGGFDDKDHYTNTVWIGSCEPQ